MRKSALFLSLLFLSGTLFAQQLSFRLANPRIMRISSIQYLEFDVQVMCDVPGTYLYTSQVKFNFNNTTFHNTSTTWGVAKVGLFNTNNSNFTTTPKYGITATITGTAPNKLFNIGVTGNAAANGPSTDDFVEITTTDWMTMLTVTARMAVITGDALAGVDFYEAGMNGFQQYITAPLTYSFYANPSLFNSRDLLNSYTGRFYSSYGWTQLGANNVVDWGVNMSTTIWDDASITQTNATAALVKNLFIGNGSVTPPMLTIPASKWLTVSGTLTSPATSSLVVESGGSLIHSTVDVKGTVKTTVTGGTVGSGLYIYHQASVPIAQNSTPAPVSGLFLGSYLFDFVESTSTWNPWGAPTNTPLDVDKGYLVQLPTGTTTYSFAGNLRAGTVSPPVLFTDISHGYNLVPNPYPSALDFVAIPTKTNLINGYWLWNSADNVGGTTFGNYSTYGAATGGGTLGATKDIAVGQAFFVKANTGSPVLSFGDAARLHSTQSFVKNSQNIENMLHLTADGNSSRDEVIVAFSDKWSVGTDEGDIEKMDGSGDAPQLSCISANEARLTIEALPFSEGDVIVPLNFALNTSTDVTFTASGMETFTVGNPIYLEDLVLNTVTDLRTSPAYTFSHTAGNNLNRFQLRFMSTTFVPSVTEIPGSIFASNGYLFIDIPSFNQSESTIGVFDALGRQLSSRIITLSGVSKIPAPVAIGVYIVRVISGNKTFTAKVLVN